MAMSTLGMVMVMMAASGRRTASSERAAGNNRWNNTVQKRVAWRNYGNSSLWRIVSWIPQDLFIKVNGLGCPGLQMRDC